MVVRNAVRLDSRVLRIGDALADGGHDVVCVGYGSASENRPAWEVHEVDGASLAGGRRLSHAALLPLARVWHGWNAAYWSDHRVRDLYEQVAATRPHVVHAHDWNTLPIAARVARETGCRFVYDSHEFASQEHQQSRSWRLFYAPFTRAIEAQFIRRAAAVITVSTSIAHEMQELYGLERMPTVVRNIPDADRLAPRPVGDRVTVLYHGGTSVGRGLVEAAASVSDWPVDYDLTIRGSMADDLRSEIHRVAPLKRVSLVPAVAPGEVVRAANSFDIGIHPSLGSSKNDEYSLPNKFFEYLNAGLALCIADLPAMASLIRTHGLGRLIARPVTPETVAAAVNGFTRDSIWRYKEASHRLAETMTWAAEAQALVNLYRERVNV